VSCAGKPLQDSGPESPVGCRRPGSGVHAVVTWSWLRPRSGLGGGLPLGCFGGHLGGHQRSRFGRSPQGSCRKWREMADLSRDGGRVTCVAVHGKEGVNGSSPLEGFEFSAWLSGISRQPTPARSLWGAPWGARGAMSSGRGAQVGLAWGGTARSLARCGDDLEPNPAARRGRADMESRCSTAIGWNNPVAGANRSLSEPPSIAAFGA
jgi:hypothetical protein